MEKETFASAETQAPTEESAENKTPEKKSFLASILNFRGLSAEDSISLASDDDDDGDGDGGSDGSADFESVFEKAFTDAQTDDFEVELGRKITGPTATTATVKETHGVFTTTARKAKFILTSVT